MPVRYFGRSSRKYNRGKPRKRMTRILTKEYRTPQDVIAGNYYYKGGVASASINKYIHHFKRRDFGTALTLTSNTEGVLAGGGSTGFVGFSPVFNLSSVVNPTDFTNLYDQYRINAVLLEMKWSIDNIPGASEKVLNPPMLRYYRDYDDANNPTDEQLKENAKTKSLSMSPNRVYKIMIKPAVLNEVRSTGTTVNFQVKWKPWLDCADTTTPHRGLKFGLTYPSNQAYGAVMINAIYYFSCRSPR